MSYPTLFSPTQIGSLRLKNRVVAAPVDTKLGTSEGEITERHINYWIARARGQAGTLITDNMTVEWPRGKTGPKPLRMDDDRFAFALSELAEEAHRWGAAVIPQISHAGRQTFQRATGTQLISASDVGWPLSDARPVAASVDQIAEIVEKFATAAWRVQRASCDGVEIHAAHGYFLASFLSPYTNQREDEYGGSSENRCRIVVEVLTAVRARVGAGFPVTVRINGSDFLPNGAEIGDAVEVAKRLVQAGADALHVSAGLYESRASTFPGPAASEAIHAPLAAAIKGAVNIPVITVGKIKTPETAERLLVDGVADLVALGRALIADPEWPLKASKRHPEEIRPCLYANECRKRIALGQRMRCDVNPDVGYEQARRTLLSSRARVVVVGGGPAGMEAAHRFADRGCHVTLLERESELGGQLRFATIPSFKKDLRDYLAFLVRQLERSRVDVLKATNAVPAIINDLRPDVVVLATGARPRTLESMPTRPRVLTALQAFAGADVGGEVTVVGGGATGCEIALHLANQKVQVRLLEATETLCIGIDPDFKDYLVSGLQAAGVEILLNTSLTKVTPTGIAVSAEEEGARELPAETVILAMGVEPEVEPNLDVWLIAHRLRTFDIGDRRSPGGLRGCTGDAAWVAEEV